MVNVYIVLITTDSVESAVIGVGIEAPAGAVVELDKKSTAVCW